MNKRIKCASSKINFLYTATRRGSNNIDAVNPKFPLCQNPPILETRMVSIAARAPLTKDH